MDTTQISLAIARYHYNADLSQLAPGESLETRGPVAMSSGVWDLEADLIAIGADTVVASDLDSITIAAEVCGHYRDLGFYRDLVW